MIRPVLAFTSVSASLSSRSRHDACGTGKALGRTNVYFAGQLGVHFPRLPHHLTPRARMTSKPSLIIFDCDGVLVDSEMLSARVLMGMMAEAGMPIDAEMFRSDFLGRSFATAAARAEERFGQRNCRIVSSEATASSCCATWSRTKTDGWVDRVLASLKVPFCLATSSSPQRLGTVARCHRLSPLL